jgi:DNA-binding MarR family transcriptional regulator
MSWMIALWQAAMNKFMHRNREAQTAGLLERLTRLMRSAQHEAGLNPAQWEALRYLARANRFSNSPTALARYLDATKGTVSQTLMALERKGLITRLPRPDLRRSIALCLTPKGRAQLERDPWLKLAADIAALDQHASRRLNAGLAKLTEGALRRHGSGSFGECRTCRYFGRGRGASSADGPHRCLLLDLALSEQDSLMICAEHAPPQ